MADTVTAPSFIGQETRLVETELQEAFATLPDVALRAARSLIRDRGTNKTMKKQNKSQSANRKGQRTQDNFRSRTNLPGPNPQANDDPSRDVHHDDNRQQQ